METRWTQPFRWGLLVAYDAEAGWEPPDGLGGTDVTATPSCLAVPVRHAQDVDAPPGAAPDEPVPEFHVEVVVTDRSPASPVFVCELDCPSGRLTVGDAENDRVVDVPPGVVRVEVAREPEESAERVVLAVTPAATPPAARGDRGSGG